MQNSRRAGLGGLPRRLDQRRDVQPRRAHRRGEQARLRAEVAVLRAAAGLERDDALDLDLRPAPAHPHLVGEREQPVEALVGQPQHLEHLRLVEAAPRSSTWSRATSRMSRLVGARHGASVGVWGYGICHDRQIGHDVVTPASAAPPAKHAGSNSAERGRARAATCAAGTRPARARPPVRAARRAAGRRPTAGRSARLQRAARSGLGRPAADHHARRSRARARRSASAVSAVALSVPSPAAATTSTGAPSGRRRRRACRRRRRSGPAARPRPRPAPGRGRRPASPAASATSRGRTGARPARRAAVAGRQRLGVAGAVRRW